MSEVNVFVGINYVLSFRHNSQQNFFAVRERCEKQPQLLQHGSGFVFYALMDAVVDRYFPFVDRLESELEEVEEKIFARGAARTNTQRLYDLKRKVTLLKHVVAPLMEAAGKFSGGRRPVVCFNSREYFRDVYDHLTRINALLDKLDNIRDTVGTAIQVNLSMVAIEKSEVNKKLAAWAGIFAVATAFAGSWGMNFKAMPELQWAYGYTVALLTIGVSCALVYRRVKRAGSEVDRILNKESQE